MNVVVLRRRLIYISIMVALLVPLYFLGNPSVRNPDGSVKVAGGTLAQIRTKYNLGQGDLGEIDPASESMRLATLGLRGVAATILWQKAEFYKREMYWDRLAATLNQIAVLQPHFIKVWEFQAHNLSYNVSVEFDNYRHRYDWVKKGIFYLIKGMKYNKHRTELPYELGWFFGNKMGVADERVQYRELYRNDVDFHQEVLARTQLDLRQEEGLGPDRKPDNWLSGRLWYEYAYDMVARGARPARSEMMFYRMGPQWLMKYAEAIQSEGYLGESARYAWRTAGREWKKFGERPIKTTFGDVIYLTEIDLANEEYQRAREEFAKFCGDVYQQMLDQAKASLTPEQLDAYAKDYVDRSFDEILLAEEAAARLELDPTEVAKRLPTEKQVEGLRRAKELTAKRDKIRHIEIYRNQINYGYWEQRCIAEQEDEAILARTNMYEADQLLEKGELDAALEKYELAWEAWSKLFNKHPAMMIDEAADAVLESIERYRRLLDQPELPEDFALKAFMEFRRIYDEQLADPALMSIIAQWPKRYPGRNFLEEMLRKSEAFTKSLERSSILPEGAAEAAPSQQAEAQGNDRIDVKVILDEPEPPNGSPLPMPAKADEEARKPAEKEDTEEVSAEPSKGPASDEHDATRPSQSTPEIIVLPPDPGEPPAPEKQ